MNFKRNLKYIITGSALFLIIYMFVAVIPMGQDISFEPVWTRSINEPVVAEAGKFPTEGIEGFSLGKYFGYFTPDGTILSSTLTDDHVSISPSAWASYPQNASSTIIHRPDGTENTVINAPGNVHLDGGRTYLFLPGGDAISQYDDSGKLVWTREHTAPITAFNSSPAGTITGYADGLLSCTGADGSERFSFYPGGSDNQVILGAALSEDGTLAACVSGIDKQRFLLIKITGDQYKIIKHQYLEGNLRRQAFVDFEKNGAYAFFEYEGGLGIIDCAKYTTSLIPFEGEITGAGECPGNTLFVVLVKNGTKYTLAAVERPDHLVASVRFTADDAFLIQREEAIYLGTNDKISRINIGGIK